MRDLLFIDDVCRLIELQINNIEQLGGQVFNAGGGKNNTLSLIETIAQFRALSLHNQQPVHSRNGLSFSSAIPKGGAYPVASLHKQLISEQVTYEDTPRKSDHCIYISDIRKAERLLGWRPEIGLETGLQQIMAWIRQNEGKLRQLYGQ